MKIYGTTAWARKPKFRQTFICRQRTLQFLSLLPSEIVLVLEGPTRNCQVLLRLSFYTVSFYFQCVVLIASNKPEAAPFLLPRRYLS